MIKRIIFLMEVRFDAWSYKRFGIELLKQNGFRVEVWDLTSVLHPKLVQSYCSTDLSNYDGLTIFNDKNKILRQLSSLTKSDFVVNLVGYNFQNLGIYRALGRSKADYFVFYTNAPVPDPIAKKTRLYILIAILKWLYSLRRIGTWKYLFLKLPFSWLGVRPARLILASGERRFNYHYPVGKNTEVLEAHTLDYDLYLDQRDTQCAERPIAVFIDEFFPFHPDYVLVDEKPWVGADRYYRSVNGFFDLVERKTGLEVVIAAHPRSNYESRPDYFKGRKCIRGQTIRLVRECRLAIGHCSTALNFTNLFYKPVIFMTFSDLEGTWDSRYVKTMADCFGKTPIAIDKYNDVDFKKEMRVDKDCYDRYRMGYIKTKDSDDMPLWQIVANRLKKLNDANKRGRPCRYSKIKPY